VFYQCLSQGNNSSTLTSQSLSLFFSSSVRLLFLYLVCFHQAQSRPFSRQPRWLSLHDITFMMHGGKTAGAGKNGDRNQLSFQKPGRKLIDGQESARPGCKKREIVSPSFSDLPNRRFRFDHVHGAATTETTLVITFRTILQRVLQQTKRTKKWTRK
jgi:hypothetical protein